MTGCVISPAAGVEHVAALGVLRTPRARSLPNGVIEQNTTDGCLSDQPEATVLDDRVSRSDQLVQALDVGRRCDVENDGPLVRIEVGEQCAAFAPIGENGRHRASGAAAFRRLDLDDLGAEIGQQLSAVLPRDCLG